MTQPTPNPALLPPGAITPAPTPAHAPVSRPVKGPSFAEVLVQKSSSVEFSGHALQRVQRRGIDVGESTLARLGGGIDRAAAKGARESVVLVDSTAFVVSVRNRTVITAVDRDHMKDHVFTNIDSAVIA
ncbi:MAG: TIGR02530 family flagellar biosynthesis protein [Thermoleophilaceae bacterium]